MAALECGISTFAGISSEEPEPRAVRLPESGRPRTFSIGTAKPADPLPLVMMPIRAPERSTSAPPLEPGATGALNCKIRKPEPAPGISSAGRIAERMPSVADQASPFALVTAQTASPWERLAVLPAVSAGSAPAEIFSAATSRRSSEPRSSTRSKTSPFPMRTWTSAAPFKAWSAVSTTPSFEMITPVAMEWRRPAPSPARTITVAAFVCSKIALAHSEDGVCWAARGTASTARTTDRRERVYRNYKPKNPCRFTVGSHRAPLKRKGAGDKITSGTMAEWVYPSRRCGRS